MLTDAAEIDELVEALEVASSPTAIRTSRSLVTDFRDATTETSRADDWSSEPRWRSCARREVPRAPGGFFLFPPPRADLEPAREARDGLGAQARQARAAQRALRGDQGRSRRSSAGRASWRASRYVIALDADTGFAAERRACSRPRSRIR
jgi:hypothetical protein